MAEEVQAGRPMVLDDPPLPEATTVAIPTDRKLSIAGLTRLPVSQVPEKLPSARLTLAAAMLRAVVFLK
jgi:hypothetical protein